MKKYKISFTGRKIGAIGIFYKIRATVEAPKNATKEEIILKLYDNYEHISNPIILNYE